MRLPLLTVSSTPRRTGYGPLFLWGGLAGSLLGITATLALLFAFSIWMEGQMAEWRRERAASNRTQQAPQEPKDPSKLSVEDLAFGEEQVARMVRDRPEMGKVQSPDPIWRYCVRGFAGEALGQRVYWDPVEPFASDTDFEFPLLGATPCIRIRRTSAWDPDYGTSERWFWAVYCLEALRDFKAREALRTKGLHGDLSRDEWIRGETRLSYEHLRRINKIYWTYWRPTSRSRRIPTVGGDTWATDLDGTYEGWYSRYAPYGWDAYAREYDAGMARIYELSRKVRKLRETSESVASARAGK
jgi:hypothetical protein